jgi:hypothetical protein
MGTIDDDMLDIVEHKRVITETATEGGPMESHENAGLAELIQRLVAKAPRKEVAV